MYSFKNTWVAQALNIVAVAMLIASSFAAFTPNTSSAAADKVTICHKTGNDSWEVWPDVSVNGFENGHKPHGDFIIDGSHPCPPVEDEEEPTDEEQCDIDGGFWNGDTCEEIVECDDNETYNEDTNTCTEDEDNNPSPEEIACTVTLGGTWDDGICNFTFCILIQNGQIPLQAIEAALALLGLSSDDFDCDEDPEEPTDYCSTVVGTQGPEYDCPSQSEVDCENAGGTWNGSSCDMPTTPAQCADGIDNDNDGSTDMNDVGCTDSSDNDESDGGDGDTGGSGDDSDDDSSGGNGGGGRNRSNDGEVAGASTGECRPILIGYVGLGKNNDLVDVVRLQLFLNEEMDAQIPVDGTYDEAAKEIVDQFQLKYSEEVLAPWVPFGLPNKETPTGYVYKTTKHKINEILCPSLNAPFPQLP